MGKVHSKIFVTAILLFWAVLHHPSQWKGSLTWIRVQDPTLVIKRKCCARQMHFDLCVDLYIFTCLGKELSVMIITEKIQTGVNCCKRNENWDLFYITKKKIIVHTKSWTWKGCAEVIKFSVLLFVHILDEWKREQLEFILLRGRDHFLIALAYCRLAFLFDSLLSSSLSTTSVPSQSFRSLAAWYQVWFFCSKSILFKI